MSLSTDPLLSSFSTAVNSVKTSGGCKEIHQSSVISGIVRGRLGEPTPPEICAQLNSKRAVYIYDSSKSSSIADRLSRLLGTIFLLRNYVDVKDFNPATLSPKPAVVAPERHNSDDVHKIAELEKTETTLRQQITDLQSNLGQQITDLQSRLERSLGDKVTTGTRLDSMEAAHKRLLKENEALTKEIATLKAAHVPSEPASSAPAPSDRDVLQQQLQRADEDLRKVRGELAASSAKINTLKNENKAAQKEAQGIIYELLKNDYSMHSGFIAQGRFKELSSKEALPETLGDNDWVFIEDKQGRVFYHAPGAEKYEELDVGFSTQIQGIRTGGGTVYWIKESSSSVDVAPIYN